MIIHKLSNDIEQISVVGRQCVAAICFERFCKKYRILHPAIDLFIDHIWKVTQVNPENFVDWEQGFQTMPITGQGEPYPTDLVEAVPKILWNDFDELTQFVFETSATTWYGSDLEGTKTFLLKAIAIAIRHEIELPDLSFYVNSPIVHHGNWGQPLTNEQVEEWRSTV